MAYSIGGEARNHFRSRDRCIELAMVTETRSRRGEREADLEISGGKRMRGWKLGKARTGETGSYDNARGATGDVVT